MDIFNFKKRKAQKLHDLGASFSDEDNDGEALYYYLKALTLDPERSTTNYNIGLIYKYQLQWDKSLEYNLKAYQLNPDDEATRWNLAIAATALRKWNLVRQVWKDNGTEVEGYSGPINMDFGETPIRLNPSDPAEVVWAKRIDPVRAEINNIPYKESGYNYRDIVLHDGAPIGSRMSNGQEFPVFNVMELFQSSDYQTITASVLISKDEDFISLEELFQKTENEFEDWTTNVRMLCKQCSEGNPHEKHDSDLEKIWTGERILGIATKYQDSIVEIFDEWQKMTDAKLLNIFDSKHIIQKLHKLSPDKGYDPTDEQSDLISQLVLEYSNVDYIEMLVSDGPKEIDVNKMAMYISMIVWESEKACERTSGIIENWILGDDETRLKIALSKEIELYPFKDRFKMNNVLTKIASDYPSLSSRCKELIKNREKENLKSQ